QDAAAPLRKQTSTLPSTLVTGCLSVISTVTSTQALARLQVDCDALAVAPVGVPLASNIFSDFDLVSPALEQHHSVRRKPLFHIHLVRQPLMMESRRVHGLLNVHTIVDHIHEDVGHGGNDSRTPRRTQHQE